MANNSGSDGPSLGIGIETEEGRQKLEGLRQDFTKFLGTLEDVLRAMTKGDEAVVKSAGAQEKLKRTTKELTDEERKLAEQQRASLAVQKEKDAVAAASITAGEKLIAQLLDQIATFGMTKLEVQAYRAELLGVEKDALPLIAVLDALTRAQFENEVQMKRDIETLREKQAAYVMQQRTIQEQDIWMHNQRVKEHEETEAWYAKQWALLEQDAAKKKAISQQQDIWMHEQRVREFQEIEAWYAKQWAAQEAAARKQIAIEQQRDVELHQMRTARFNSDLAEAEQHRMLIQKRDEELFQRRTKAANDAASLTERQAIADIRFAEMTTAAKIKEIEKFLAYQARANSGEISQKTMRETFAPSVGLAAGSLDKLKQELAEAEAILGASKKRTALTAEQEAERAAIAEIAWERKSVAGRIAELERLQAYQNKRAITPETIQQQFAPVVIKDLPNLANYRKELAEIEKGHKGAHQSGLGFVDALSQINFGSSRARGELVVLAHELAQGSFKRFGLSMMVLAEYTNAASLAFTGMGIATLALVGTIALLGYAMVKGMLEQREMQNALILTGNYAGTTEMQMNAMAHTIADTGLNIGKASDALITLAKSGKFSSEQMDMIAASVVKLEQNTGAPINDMIKHFETLQVKVSDTTTAVNEKLVNAVLKLDEQFHYLTPTMLAAIQELQRVGDVVGASALATDQFNEAVKRMADEGGKNIGYFQGRWIFLKNEIAGVLHLMGQWGKTTTEKDIVDAADARLKQHREQLASRVRNGGTTTERDLQIEKELLDKVTTARIKYNEVVTSEKDKGEITRMQSQTNVDMANAEKQEEMMKRRARGLDAFQEKYQDYIAMVQRARNLEEKTGVVNPKFTPEKVVEHIELLKADSMKKTKDPAAKNDGRMVDLRSDQADFKAQYKLIEDSTDANIQLLRQGAKVELGIQSETYEAERVLRDKQMEDLEKMYDARSAAIAKFSGRNKVEQARARAMQTALDNEFDAAAQKIDQSQDKIDNEEKLEYQKAYQDMLKNLGKIQSDNLGNLEKQIDKQELYNASIGKTPEQIQLAKEQLEQERIAQLELDAAFMQGIVAKYEGDKVAQDAFRIRLEGLNAEILKRKELAQLEANGAAISSATPDGNGMTKAADLASKSWKKAGEEISKSLKESFGKGGEAIGNMFKIYANGQADAIKIEAEFEKKRAAALGTGNMQQRLYNAEQERSVELAQNQLNTYGGMTNAAMNYFEKGSTGYNAMKAASQVFHAAEMGMMMIRMVLAAKEAVLNQGKGDPYSAFVRMAAMAAIVAGLGVAIGSMNAGSQHEDVAKSRQETQGAGTVLGDSEAKSESISKSLEYLGDNSDISLMYTSQMVKSLHNIESGIGGLANIIYRTSGMTTGTNFGIQQGQLSSNKGDPILGMFGLQDFTNKIPILGGIITKLQSLWGNTTQTIVDTGLQIEGTVQDLMNGRGVNQYAEVEQKKTSWFGAVKDYDYSTVNQAASAEISKQFGAIFTDLNDALIAAGSALGRSGDTIKQSLDNAQIKVDPMSFKDLKGQELVDALNAVVSKAADQIAEAALPGLEKFVKVGEGYAQTAIRVSTGMEKAQVALERLGVTAVSYTDILNKQGDVEAEAVRDSITRVEFYSHQEAVLASFMDLQFQSQYKWVASLNGVGQIMKDMTGTADELIAAYKKLIDIRRIMMVTSTNENNTKAGGGILTQETVRGAGGLDSLQTGANDFLEKYFTDAERAAIETARVSEEFKRLGQNLPANREEYRKLVTSIDMSSAAGQRLYGGLIALAGEFDNLMEMTGDSSAKLQEQQDIVDNIAESLKRWYDVKKSADALVSSIDTDMGKTPDNQAKIDNLWKLLDANSDMKGVTAEQQLEMATELQGLIKEKYKVEKENATNLLNVAKSLRKYLDDLKVGDLSPGTNTDKLMEAQRQYNDTLSKAKAGDTDAAGALQGKAETYLKLAREYYASSDPYKAIFADVYANLDQYAVTLESEQQLIADGNQISTEQLAELQRLRDIVVKAQEFAGLEYAKAQETFVVQANILQTLQNQLGVMSTLPDLLKGMPADLAATLGPLLIKSTVVEDPSKTLEAAAPVTPINVDATAAAGVPEAYSRPPSWDSLNFGRDYSSTPSTVSGTSTWVDPNQAALEAYIAANGPLGSHEQGLTKVPYDGYMAELHKDERVLTAGEAAVYNDLMARMKRAGKDLNEVAAPQSWMNMFFGRDQGDAESSKTQSNDTPAPQPEKVLTSSTAKPYTSGNTNNGNAAMAQEIKALREELAGLRRDAARQHQESVATNYDANNRAADKVSKATCEAADKANWKQKSAPTMR